jgi:hypothetical protein
MESSYKYIQFCWKLLGRFYKEALKEEFHMIASPVEDRKQPSPTPLST